MLYSDPEAWARIKSPEKRSAILQAAVREIAEVGLGAPTAKIARRAGLATGTLFTYFANKEKLLNELYLELKIEVYRRVNTNFPRKANLERRARKIADLIVQLANRDEVPLRLILGVDAEKWVQQAEAGRASEAEKWRHLTMSTVFDNAESNPELLNH
jgi:AcrR family transcriptional regulator